MDSWGLLLHFSGSSPTVGAHTRSPFAPPSPFCPDLAWCPMLDKQNQV